MTKHVQRRTGKSLIGRTRIAGRRAGMTIAAVGAVISVLSAVLAPIAASRTHSARTNRARPERLSWMLRRASGPQPRFINVLHLPTHRAANATLPGGVPRRGHAAAATRITARQSSAAPLTVCPTGCAFSQIAPAVAAASPGDTIKIAPGTYNGGFTIDKSLRLLGAGASATIIKGGGPVVTIGSFGAASEPTVAITGITMTGGITRSSPESTPFTGKEGVFAAGGGVEIPPNADFIGGATVTLSNSVINDNRVAPKTAADSGIPCPSDIAISCINGDLPFAGSFGGGIDNWGTLTLANTTVSNNLVGSASGLSTDPSDADGAGIQSWLGPVTISNSTISGNHASATAPNARFADTGGIFLEGGTLTMSNSSVTHNEASLSASMPNDVTSGTLALAGGIHLSSNVPTAMITNSTITGNTASMTNTLGDANAFSGGLHVDIGVTLSLSNSILSDNHVEATTLPGSSGNAAGDSAAGEIHGTINNTRFTDNTVSVSSVAGNAVAAAGASILFGSVSNSLVHGSHVQASGPLGAASVRGGGLLADQGGMTLRATTVSGNSADAEGQSAIAQGGGIFDAPIPNGPPGGPLILQNTSITGNLLTASAGASLQGAGLYIQSEPLTLTNGVIARNTPDQCYGC